MEGFRLRHVLKDGVVLDGPRIEFGADADQARQFQQALLLATERGTADARRQEERFDAERIAREEQFPRLRVPDREREHAAQAADRVLAPPVVERSDDGLAVALCDELRTELLGEFGPNLEVVVDLAVERQRVAFRILRRTPPQAGGSVRCR